MPPSPTLPDTAEFPRVPSNPITQALTRMLGLSSESDLLTYHGDGTVENTKMLSGKTADQFLQIDPGKNVCP